MSRNRTFQARDDPSGDTSLGSPDRTVTRRLPVEEKSFDLTRGGGPGTRTYGDDPKGQEGLGRSSRDRGQP